MFDISKCSLQTDPELTVLSQWSIEMSSSDTNSLCAAVATIGTSKTYNFSVQSETVLRAHPRTRNKCSKTSHETQNYKHKNCHFLFLQHEQIKDVEKSK